MLDRGIYYLRRAAPGPPRIEFYEFSTGRTSSVAQVKGSISNLGLSMSPTSRSFLFTAYEGESDIMLVENFR